MKRLMDCSMVVVVIFGYWIFVINPAYQRWVNWHYRTCIQEYSIETGHRAQAAIIERGTPELLPHSGTDWGIKSIDQWVAEQPAYDIRFTLHEGE